uniref:Diguanylate cyclase n=1 Tax=Dictyoglomus thermophilum TaxID=14 RepID=A0A7C3MIK4_DICTH
MNKKYKTKIIPKNFYKKLLEHITDGIYFVDTNRKIIYWNKSAEIITGYKKKEIIGKYCHDNILRHIDEKGNELCLSECPLVYAIKEDKIVEKQVFLHRKDGVRLPVLVSVNPIKAKNGEIIGAVEIFRETSETLHLKKMVSELYRKTYIDELTEIPNRRFLDYYLDLKINEFQKYHHSFGVLFIDIDDFKKINDTYGHKIGDMVLKTVAETLKNNIRATDMVGRYGGEEFIVVYSDLEKKNILYQLAEKLRILVKNSHIHLEEKILNVTVSIGGTLVKEDDNKEKIIERADNLMYQAKKEGKDRVIVN